MAGKNGIKNFSKHLASIWTMTKQNRLIVDALKAELLDIPVSQCWPELQRQHPSMLTWCNFLQCCINYWYMWTQDDYVKEWFLESNIDRQLWTKRLVAFMWQECYKTWKHRCNKQHESTGHQQDVYQHWEATQQVRTYYQYMSHLFADDQNSLLAQPLEDLLQSDSYNLRQWLKTNAAAFYQVIQDAEKYHFATCSDLIEYFTQDWHPP